MHINNISQSPQIRKPQFETFVYRSLSGAAYSDSWAASQAGYFPARHWRDLGFKVPSAKESGCILIKRSLRVGQGDTLHPVLVFEGRFDWVAYDWDFLFSAKDFEGKTPDVNNVGTSTLSIQKEGEEGVQGSLMMGNASEGVNETPAEKGTCSENRFPEKTKRGGVDYYVPEGLNLPSDCPVSESIYYLSDTIICKQIWDRKNSDVFVNLMAKYLRENVPEWRSTWDYCQKANIIERTAGYRPGERSYGYRLCEPYRLQRWSIRTTHLPVLVKRQEVIRKKHSKRPVMVYLERQLERLTVDWKDFDLICPPEHENRLGYEAHLRTIDEKRIRIIADPFSARIHTNLTNLYKPARRLLRVDGEVLGETDIRNSQPLFLAIAAASRGYRDELFMSLCEKGTLYEAVADMAGGMMRETLKKELLKAIYARNGYRGYVKGIFVRMFPTIAGFCEKVKATDHELLAKHMQKAERRFIVDTVAERLRKNHPDVWIGTIHDSILAKRSDCPLVTDIMQEEFAALGVRPFLNWE